MQSHTLAAGLVHAPRGFHHDSQMSNGRTPDQVAYDYVQSRALGAYTLPTFFQEAHYFLVEPHLPYLQELQVGVDLFLGLLAYFVIEPRKVQRWCHTNVLCREQIPSTLARTGKQVLQDMGQWIRYQTPIACKFLILPWRSPEELAMRASRQLANPKYFGIWAAKDLPETIRPEPALEGMVRVKWYPSPEAHVRWPSGMGDLWVDLPEEPDGGLDLGPLKRLWGLENSYVILPGPGKRVRIGREPDEKISAIAWRVALNKNSVLGVVERPSPTTVAARQARARFKRALRPDVAIPALLTHVFWIAATFVALIAFTLWRTFGLYVRGAIAVVSAILRTLLYALCAVWHLVRWCGGTMWYSVKKARRGASSCRASCGTLWEVGREWLLWLGRGAVAWIVAVAEALFLDASEVSRLQREGVAETELSDSEYSSG